MDPRNIKDYYHLCQFSEVAEIALVAVWLGQLHNRNFR